MDKEGRIVKGISGFYYVDVEGSGIYECKAKGVFRKQNKKPMVGDMVKIMVVDEENRIGNIESILERKNELIRPAVSNVDQAIIIFAMKKPKPNLNLLDRFLIMMEQEKINTVICFNKSDLVTEEEVAEVRKIYQRCGYEVLFISVMEEEGIQQVKEVLKGKVSTVAGPSGVGKSSLINLLQPHVEMETNDISQKIDRGKHTTRHSQLISLGENSYIIDTPGFSSLSISDCLPEELKNYFVEFEPYFGQCKFVECTHIHEPGCRVKNALEMEEISKVRYDHYVEIYEELKRVRRY